MYKILIIDDEKLVTQGLTSIITRLNPEYSVVGAAYNVNEGIAMTRKFSPNIIISDIRMPQTDGLEMIKQLKSSGCSAKFIILSGYSEFEYARKGMEMGVKYYLLKPVNTQELNTCIQMSIKELENEEDHVHSHHGHKASSEKKNNDRFMISEHDLTQLKSCIDRMNIEESQLILDSIFQQLLSEPMITIEAMKLTCLKIILTSLKSMSSLQIQLYEFLGKNVLSLENISRYETAEQLKNWLINVVKSMIEIKSMGKSSGKNDTITEIKEYISSNYSKDLTLSELSSRFFLNPCYLSQLFKERTGESYLNYVTSIRIDKAKQLLKNTNLKVSTICERVGYSDPIHFSKLFEKRTGIKPSFYRKDTAD